ncbi:hypothetical protein BASA81_005484 [Batrachochytrium salamandrivorans]|nr:hypothetical protein BASA81_005484 [Batrachochytrium salamandrivorans]
MEQDSSLPSAEVLMAKLRRQTVRIMNLEAELAECREQIQHLGSRKAPPPPPPPPPPPSPPTRDTQSSFEYKHLLLLQKMDNQTKELEYVQGKYLQSKRNQRKQSNGIEAWELEALQDRVQSLEQLCERGEDEDKLWREMQRLRLESLDYQNALQESRRQMELANVQFEKQQLVLIAAMQAMQVDRPQDLVARAEEIKHRLGKTTELAKRARDALQANSRENHQLGIILGKHFNDRDRLQSLIQELFASPLQVAHTLAEFLSQVQTRFEKIRGECILMKHEIDECFAIACESLGKKRTRFTSLHEAIRELAVG